MSPAGMSPAGMPAEGATEAAAASSLRCILVGGGDGGTTSSSTSTSNSGVDGGEGVGEFQNRSSSSGSGVGGLSSPPSISSWKTKTGSGEGGLPSSAAISSLYSLIVSRPTIGGGVSASPSLLGTWSTGTPTGTSKRCASWNSSPSLSSQAGNGLSSSCSFDGANSSTASNGGMTMSEEDTSGTWISSCSARWIAAYRSQSICRRSL